MQAPETITCVECGAPAALLSHPPPDEGFLPGDVVAYVCTSCGQRFDLVLEDEEPDRG